MNVHEVTVEDLAVSVCTIPTDQPEADGTIAWSSTTMVLVQASGGGLTGLGYTYAGPGAKPVIEGPLRTAVLGRSALDVPGAWEAMVRAIRNLGRPGLVSCAISAVDTALWDLKARLLELPVCRLLGMAHEDVPVYGSGGFTTYDEAAARAQLERWVGEWAIPRVKIKIGQSWGTRPDRDLARIAFAREVIGPEVELFVDVNGGYTRKQAIRIAHAMAEHDVTWFEEPVSSDDLAGLREVREQTSPDTAAGEYGYDLVYFARMVAAQAVDCLQIDVTPLRGDHRLVAGRRCRRGAQSAGLRALRTEPARPRRRRRPQLAASGVLPRPRSHRGHALRGSTGSHRWGTAPGPGPGRVRVGVQIRRRRAVPGGLSMTEPVPPAVSGPSAVTACTPPLPDDTAPTSRARLIPPMRRPCRLASRGTGPGCSPAAGPGPARTRSTSTPGPEPSWPGSRCPSTCRPSSSRPPWPAPTRPPFPPTSPPPATNSPAPWERSGRKSTPAR